MSALTTAALSLRKMIESTRSEHAYSQDASELRDAISELSDSSVGLIDAMIDCDQERRVVDRVLEIRLAAASEELVAVPCEMLEILLASVIRDESVARMAEQENPSSEVAQRCYSECFARTARLVRWVCRNPISLRDIGKGD